MKPKKLKPIKRRLDLYGAIYPLIGPNWYTGKSILLTKLLLEKQNVK